MAENTPYGTLYGGSPKQQMELLTKALGYIVPPDQAQTAVRALLDTLGSFSAIVTAPKRRLSAMPGMNSTAAEFLYLVADIARLYMEEQAGHRYRVTDSASAADLMRPKFLGQTSEIVCVMLLDGKRQMLFNGVLTEGALGAVPLYIRRLINLCIEFDAHGVVLAHNHPSGMPLPSREDTIVTRQLANALMGIDARLHDHLILAGDETFSFFDSGILQQATAQLIEQKRRELDTARKSAELLAEEGTIDF